MVSNAVGECGRCGMVQRAEKCKKCVSVRMDVESEGSMRSVSAFTPIVEEICDGEDVSQVALLSCGPFDAVVNESQVGALQHNIEKFHGTMTVTRDQNYPVIRITPPYLTYRGTGTSMRSQSRWPRA